MTLPFLGGTGGGGIRCVSVGVFSISALELPSLCDFDLAGGLVGVLSEGHLCRLLMRPGNVPPRPSGEDVLPGISVCGRVRFIGLCCKNQ